MSDHLNAALKLANDAEALAARLKTDQATAVAWGLIYANTAEIYLSEQCIGNESDIRSEADTHNEYAEQEGELENRIVAVPLFLGQPALNWRAVDDAKPEKTPDGYGRLCIVRIDYKNPKGEPEQAIVYDWWREAVTPDGVTGYWGNNPEIVTHWLYAEELLETVK